MAKFKFEIGQKVRLVNLRPRKNEFISDYEILQQRAGEEFVIDDRFLESDGNVMYEMVDFDQNFFEDELEAVNEATPSQDG